MAGLGRPARPAVGVLALQGDVREHLRVLADCGVTAGPVRRPVELATVDALVIPGGESTTMSNLAIDFGLLEPVRDRIKTGMPVYGSCAGMIMLASEVLDGRADQQTFGGIEMAVRRNAFGRQVDSFEAPVEIGDVGAVGDGAFDAVFIRAPWVEHVSEGVRVLGRVGAGGAAAGGASAGGASTGGASTGGAAGRIVAVRQGNLLATAFHPELTGDLRIHRFFVDLVRAAATTTEE